MRFSTLVRCSTFLAAATVASAAERPHSAPPITRTTTLPLTPPLRAMLAERLALRDAALQRIEFDDPSRGGTIMVEFVDGGAALELDVRRLRADGFRVYEHRGPQLVTTASHPSLTLRGDAFLEGDAHRWRAAVTIENDRLRAFLHAEDGSMRAVQPLSDIDPSADPQLYVAYRGIDVDPIEGSCGTISLPKQGSSGVASEWKTAAASTALKKAELAIEGDVAYFVAKGSSLPNAQSDVETIFNSITSIYEAEVGITYDISSLMFETDGSEQYSGMASDKLLENFRAYWNANYGSIQRDTVHLLTGKNLSSNIIGLAYVGVICNKSFGYGLSESTFSANMLQRVAVTAHEIGHNWNANHCNGQADCAIMCSTIGGCSGQLQSFGNFETNEIEDFRDQIGCLATVQPPATVPFLETFEASSLDKSLWKDGGGATISTKGIGETSGTRAVNLDGGSKPDSLTSKTIDFSAMGTSAELSFYAQNRGAETGENLIVEYLDATNAWVQLVTAASTGTPDGVFKNIVSAIPPGALHSNGKLRFRTDGNQSNDDWYIDDIQVRPTSTAPPFCVVDMVGVPHEVPVLSIVASQEYSSPEQIIIRNCSTNNITLFIYMILGSQETHTWASLPIPTFDTLAPNELSQILVGIADGDWEVGYDHVLIKFEAITNGIGIFLRYYPTTQIITPKTYFVAGDELSGSIGVTDDIDEAWFIATEDEEFEFTVTVPNQDLKPRITLENVAGDTLEEVKLKASANPQQFTFSASEAGLHRLQVFGRNGTTGDFAISTSRKFSGRAAPKSYKLKPSKSGGTVTAEASLLPGATMDITVVPTVAGSGPYSMTFSNAVAANLAADWDEKALPNGGIQFRNVRMLGPGLTTVTISGFAAKEPIYLTLSPNQPALGTTQRTID